MEIKCGSKIFNCTRKDLIYDNGVRYLLITQECVDGWHSYSPTIPKTLFKKLLKDGKIRKSKCESLDFYEFVESDGK